jgi:D-alanine-D-alanine ligase
MISSSDYDALSSPRVLILHNQPILPVDHPDADSEHEVLFTADAVRKALVEAGYEVDLLEAGRDPGAMLDGLRRHRPDVVFNLFEGLADFGDTEAHAAGLLEWLGIPFTGCPYQTLCLARSKHLTKHLLRGAGLPTPEFFVVEDLPVPSSSLEWPVIVKPANQDASVGVDQGSVVADQQRLEERVAWVLENYGPPVMVEEFIRGRELNVGLIEAPDLLVLPISEILFTDKDPDFWPIVTYDAKWKPGTRDYEATPPAYPARVSPRLRDKLQALAKQAFHLLGCRDYARVDFRVRGSKPFILEVNPNPDFSPTAGLSGGASVDAGRQGHSMFPFVDLPFSCLGRRHAELPCSMRVREHAPPYPLSRPRPIPAERRQLFRRQTGIRSLCCSRRPLSYLPVRTDSRSRRCTNLRSTMSAGVKPARASATRTSTGVPEVDPSGVSKAGNGWSKKKRRFTMHLPLVKKVWLAWG